MKKILSLLFLAAFATFASAQEETPVKIFGGITPATSTEYLPNALRFTFENNSGKTIANCNFQMVLPEGVEIKKDDKGKYVYAEGDATEGMTYSIKFKNNKYTITVYDGEFDETAGKTIIILPLEGTLTGNATISKIAFGDPDAANICKPADFAIDLTTAINGISAEETKSGAIYNIAGQRVSKANKGIYVVDGKKVAVK
jgi:hypothetical protein